MKQIEQKPTEDESNQVSATQCANCNTTTTPLWRRAPNGDTICNACGLYLKARNALRPPTLKRSTKPSIIQTQETHTLSAANAPNGTCPGNGQCNGTGGSPSCEGCPAFNQHQVNRHTLICANCRTTTTPLWRRDNEGNTICNACGLYYKLHHVHRPVSMKRTLIKRRKRVIVSGKSVNEEEEEDELEYSSEETPEDEENKNTGKKQKSTPPPTQSTPSAVPAIEDYIEPKRLSISAIQHDLPSVSNTNTRLPPPPRTPPLHRTLPTLQRFDPILSYRQINLPPIATKQNPYQDLSDFDYAMTRLERLRRRMLPEQGPVLSRLTSDLQDIVQQAEHILSKTP